MVPFTVYEPSVILTLINIYIEWHKSHLDIVLPIFYLNMSRNLNLPQYFP